MKKMNNKYKSLLTKEQLVYNILYFIRNNPPESLEKIIERVLTVNEDKESSK